jgi:hypothetical protein
MAGSYEEVPTHVTGEEKVGYPGMETELVWRPKGKVSERPKMPERLRSDLQRSSSPILQDIRRIWGSLGICSPTGNSHTASWLDHGSLETAIPTYHTTPIMHTENAYQTHITIEEVPSSPERPRTVDRRTLPVIAETNPITYQPTKGPRFSAACYTPEAPSTPLGRAVRYSEHHAELPESPITPPRTKTMDSDSSRGSSIRATTLYIEPSPGLRAMQSVGEDVGIRSPYAMWNRSDRYLNSQLSLPSVDAYKPTGSPRSVFNSMEGIDIGFESDETGLSTAYTDTENLLGVRNADTPCYRPESSSRTASTTPCYRPASMTSCYRPASTSPSDHRPASTTPSYYRSESTMPNIYRAASAIPSYGPATEDMRDLIDREAAYSEEQRRKEKRDRQPLRRLASLSKEIKGEMKRSLSFERRGNPRGFQVRAREEKGEVRTVVKLGRKLTMRRRGGDKDEGAREVRRMTT